MHRLQYLVATASTAFAGALNSGVSQRQSTCSVSLAPSYPAPVVASGWEARLIAQGIKSARGLALDNAGALLVAQQEIGITRVTFEDNGGTCLVLSGTSTLVEQNDLTHGIALSADGKTLYASSAEAVFSWSYDSAAGAVGSDRATIVNNMTNTDHVSRTLLISPSQPNMLVVSRGSADNIDYGTRELASGRSQIRAFDLDNLPADRPFEYSSEGRVLGMGLRNDVGVAEEPLTGGIYSVENSVDEMTRQGVDIHTNMPGEELNFLGSLSDEAPATPPNYGYPDCLAVWNTTGVPSSGGVTVGTQITADTSNVNDTACMDRVAPRLTFQAHTAPLDLHFAADGSEAYVTFHGSWNRDPPIGYKLSSIAFANGAPIEPSDSTTALADIMTNVDVSKCPGSCFRPVGLALDGQDRLFMSSDATGEIYVLRKTAA